MQRFAFPVNVTCENCVAPIEENILKLQSEFNDVSVDVNTTTKIAVIYVDDDRFSREAIHARLKQTLDDIGMLGDEEPALRQQAQAAENLPKTERSNPRRKRKIQMHWIMGAVGIVTGLGLLALTLSGIALPMLLMYFMMGGSALLSLIIGAPTIYEAGKQLFRAKTLAMDTVLSVSALIAIGITIASFFFPVLPMMCNAGLLIFGFRHIGQAIEESLKQKINLGLSFFSRLAPFYLFKVDHSDQMKFLPFEFLEAGHLIQVQRGSIIPVDGTLEDDDAAIIESINDGSLLSRRLQKNAPVLAGMTVADDHPTDFITVLANKNVYDSRLGQLNQAIEKARQEKAPLVTTTQRALKWFLPAVLGLALVSSLIISLCFPPFLAIPVAITCGISILVSACPCTLGMITPMAMKIGIQKAEDRGIIFRSGRSLQKADQIDTIVFDLNGTLTVGKPDVVSFALSDKSIERKKLFAYINSLESISSHPIANAIRHFTSTAKYNTPKPESIFSTIDRTKHHGLRSTINDQASSLHGKTLTIGNAELLSEFGIPLPDQADEHHPAHHTVYIAIDNKLTGYFRLKDPLRKDAKSTLDELRKMGKDIYICTGTDEGAAKKYADELGIPHEKVKWGYRNVSDDPAIPTKVQLIDSLQAAGKKIAMVGDAGNDATAIKKAHLGIAMKASDALTSHLAGANILSDSLTPIVSGFEIAKQTVSNIKQNLIFSLGYNMIALAAPIIIATVMCCVFAPPVALAILAFALSPAIGAGLMILQSSLVMANVFRFKKQDLPHTDTAQNAANNQDAHASMTTSRLLRQIPRSDQPAPLPSISGPSALALLVEGDCDTYSPDSALVASVERMNYRQ